MSSFISNLFPKPPRRKSDTVTVTLPEYREQIDEALVTSALSDADIGFLPAGEVSRLVTQNTVLSVLPQAPQALVEDQWAFCPPIFDTSTFRQEFKPQCILPFIDLGSTPKDGHFSTVKEATIHADHHDDGTKGKKRGSRVALKKLKPLSSEPGYNVEMAWEQEAAALGQISELRHKHLISRTGAFKHGNDYYIMFEWADGGTLREVWETRRAKPTMLEKDHVMSVLEQLAGLAGALSRLHNTNNKTRTAMVTSNAARGGSSKTSARSRTLLSPPRSDDGYSSPNTLNVPKIRVNPDSSDDEYYTSDNPDDADQKHWRHGDLKPDNVLQFKVPNAWLGTLKIADLGLAKQHAFATSRRADHTQQKYSTSHYEAPEVITDRTLGRPRSRRYDIWSFGCMVLEFSIWLLYGYDGLEKFYKEGGNLDHHKETIYFKVDPSERAARVSEIVSRWIEYILQFDPECKSSEGAIKDLIELARDRLLVVTLPEANMNNDALDRCRADASELEGKLNSILKKARHDQDRGTRGNFSERIGVIDDSESGVGSLNDIQIGLPKLPEVESLVFYGLLSSWLQDCDLNHPECHHGSHADRVPTRLIDVGEDGDHALVVNLCTMADTRSEQKGDLRYIALSHPWGSVSDHDHCCTTTKNIKERLRNGITIGQLPNTFRHAVQVTQALGIRYLWIDSLCIIQGDDGDFDTEAKNMESVFSSAYCVIAASRASGTSSGFLWKRPERRFLRVKQASQDDTLYICEAIDNFQHDVIEGTLNQRGWVLQERVLARRTIYFTEKQTYWECGQGFTGVTDLFINSNKAAFLGDPNFPEVATVSSRGARIRLYESLYQQYSRLSFTKVCDRPIAIAGLEQRLVSAFKTQGGYGVFEGRFFGRSLLWERDETVTPEMKKIDFPKCQKYLVPTWSWMAYEGAITFMDVPFSEVDWEHERISDPGIRSPWTPRTPSSSSYSWHTGNSTERVDLTAHARELVNLDLAENDIIYDQGCRPPGDRDIRCVVVGRQRAGSKEVDIANLDHYILIVASREEFGGDGVYERVGAGSLLGSQIVWDRGGLRVSIF
ncbi:serine threonine kinase [Fusarium albosuccineum]|uniref:Serine threonine kinase n=1 Tax=Fusarium albosuccineum TaxID=1237068 RepID=A0A8H4PC32_9HYPO|nr:serine threonine kinase [Fusarium albosuccineum]